MNVFSHYSMNTVKNYYRIILIMNLVDVVAWIRSQKNTLYLLLFNVQCNWMLGWKNQFSLQFWHVVL